MPLPDRIHPSLLRIFQRSTPDDTIAFVDQSYVAPEEDFSESFYILVGTAIKFEHLGSTRSLLRETAQSSYWHTTESMRSCDGRKKVEEMLKLCDDFEDLQYIACLRPLQRNQDIEHARQDCLEQLITTLTKNEHSLKGIIFEARHSQSDNDKDRNTLKRMRKKKLLHPEINLAWVSPADETCLWIPDLVAFTYRRTFTHGGQSTSLYQKYLEEHCEILKVTPKQQSPKPSRGWR